MDTAGRQRPRRGMQSVARVLQMKTVEENKSGPV